MEKFLKANKDERPEMIILGILAFYFLVLGFIFYLFFLHRLSVLLTVILSLGLTLIYIPRFLIIKKLKTKDEVKIIDDYIMINGVGINFSDIKDFKVQEMKPQVVFFLNNKMIVFNEAIFYLRLSKEQTFFTVIGSEKISLLKEFLAKVIQ